MQTKSFVWHPYTQMRDWVKWNNRVIVKGDGFYLVDNKGRKLAWMAVPACGATSGAYTERSHTGYDSPATKDSTFHSIWVA